MSSQQPFKPKRFFQSKHLQTVYNTFFPPENRLRSKFYFEDILLQLSDDSGDALWLEHNPPIAHYSSSGPVWNGIYLVMIHGMEGTSDSAYLVSLAQSALLKGYGCVRMNLRNCGRGQGFSKGTYNIGQTKDVQDTIDFVWKKLSHRIFLSGFSLSASLVLKYLGEKRNHKVETFSSTNPPLDLFKGCKFIDSREARFYRDRFVSGFRKKIKNKIIQLPPELEKNAFRAKTFFEFDDQVTAPFFGYKGAAEYYQDCSSIRYIPNIRHPGIVIHSEDDPVVPPFDWETIRWDKLPHIQTILSPKGGHVGFLTDPTPEIPDGRWLNKIILDYFDSKTNSGS
ncbi:YheT family hydrolase [Leptospira santarosai]|uniref:Alpha/beta hydrolase family protein n=1 Tax=Leptospira santarosai str. MOR084 TaxID=1049984 RepID=A0A0E2B9G1_9LEPT|nr:alpha/beta fold hydrolase [Leptospira santarosai]EKO31837.1 alpha/beta hydrolase family protein [Leptospira santarosai str. MOR084]EKR92023.1 alpha/beta hydrolase family protein [Leptospira santarosai str. CBC379]EMF89358.1 alpha/beta hydrolase family protein [Leptospira santarosai str. ST188]EMJ50418.1 alpha/beta hydrolase family protein [Leptospira santarosai str. HAI1349]EMO15778.1 alpha/beta hydrolase family protein [Leptospira santarosai str. CBC523]